MDPKISRPPGLDQGGALSVIAPFFDPLQTDRHRARLAKSSRACLMIATPRGAGGVDRSDRRGFAAHDLRRRVARGAVFSRCRKPGKEAE